MKRVLVVCTGNRCRSQMAEGWLRHYGGEGIEVRSAGTRPNGVHPLAIDVMEEAGVDISQHTSDLIDEYESQHFDVVVTVCDAANEACPYFANADRRVHQPFEDPDRPEMAAKDPAAFRDLFVRIRDEIRDWAREFVRDLEDS